MVPFTSNHISFKKERRRRRKHQQHTMVDLDIIFEANGKNSVQCTFCRLFTCAAARKQAAFPQTGNWAWCGVRGHAAAKAITTIRSSSKTSSTAPAISSPLRDKPDFSRNLFSVRSLKLNLCTFDSSMQGSSSPEVLDLLAFSAPFNFLSNSGVVVVILKRFSRNRSFRMIKQIDHTYTLLFICEREIVFVFSC